MDRTPGGGRAVMGAVGTCLFRSFIGVLGVCLVLVTAFWIWAATAPGRNEDEARADMRAAADAHKERLARAAADGRLTDAELAAEFPGAARRGAARHRAEGGIRPSHGRPHGHGPGFPARLRDVRGRVLRLRRHAGARRRGSRHRPGIVRRNVRGPHPGGPPHADRHTVRGAVNPGRTPLNRARRARRVRRARRAC